MRNLLKICTALITPMQTMGNKWSPSALRKNSAATKKKQLSANEISRIITQI
jgi:hypothetical protein